MRCTALLVPERDPDVYVAYVPVLDVTTQGSTIEAALAAAREAVTLARRGLVADGEPVLEEPPGAITASVELPTPARLTA